MCIPGMYIYNLIIIIVDSKIVLFVNNLELNNLFWKLN